jgi:hypothetical protein
LSKFIKDNASKRCGYEKAWREWTEYREELHRSVRPDQFLGNLAPEERSVRLSQFIRHKWEAGTRGKALQVLMSNLKMVFLEALVDVTCFSSELVLRTSRAARHTAEEKLALDTKRRAQQPLPASMDIIWPIRDHFWTNESWLCKGLDRRAVWLAIAMGFDAGPRISNVTRKDGKRADHCIRAQQVHFLFRATDGKCQKVCVGNAFRAATAQLSIPECIIRCEYRFLTGKVDMPYAHHTIARRTTAESTLLDDLAVYFVNSGVQEEDELFTRYPGPAESHVNGGIYSRKSLTRKEYKAGLAWAAVNAGLPPGSLQSSSVRSGCAEIARATGATDEELRHGRWGSKSSVPERHYLSTLDELSFGTDGSGPGSSTGSFARVTDREAAEFNLDHVKCIALARGKMDYVPGDVPSLVGGK